MRVRTWRCGKPLRGVAGVSSDGPRSGLLGRGRSRFASLRDWWLYQRPWWVRARYQCVNTAANNRFLYLGPFTFAWDHEFTPYVAGEGFGWLPQPRRAFRIWFRVFTKLLELNLWRDTGHYCECGVHRGFCDDPERHARRIAWGMRTEGEAA